MHQDAALRARRRPASPLGGSYRAASVTDEFGTFPFVRKRSGVLKDKNRSIGRGKTLCGCLEMPDQNVLFTDTIIVHEAIGCLRTGPVLTGKRNGLPHALPQLLQQRSKPLA